MIISKGSRTVARLAVALVLVGLAQVPGRSSSPQAGSVPPVAAANDNRQPAGVLRDGTLTLRLEVALTRWQAEGESGATRTVQAFAEQGQVPRIPGPLVRVPEGTEMHVAVTNRLSDSLRLHGMMPRPGDSNGVVEIAPGATRNMRFKSGRAGTYFYWAETTGASYVNRRGIDSQLTGAFVVDPARPADRVDDRIFVITEWREFPVPVPSKFTAAINGRSWPHTERLTLPFGLPAEWRVINGSFGAHPMHLHGTFYTVESRGDAVRDSILGSDGRRLVTTELMEPGTTMAMRWVPDRVGNWLFHCHILAHVSGGMRLQDLPPAQREHAHADEHDIDRAMAGLVIGITVPPGDETAAPDLDPGAPRRFTLEMIQRKNQYASHDGFGFRIIDGSMAPAPIVSDDGPATSPTLILTQGQPVVIDLVSRLDTATQIHWHGIELESYNDGVPGWSGNLRQITPLVKPGATYQVRYTPPRAGTFIYHTHAHDEFQLSGGLYGALVALEPGKQFDPETDRIVLIGGGGPGLEVNRSTNPPPLDLRVGVKYRFRLINITPNFTAIVSLRAEGAPLQWKALAKDGAELPPAQVVKRQAQQVISVGETYDFEFEPATPGELRLEVVRRGLSAFLTSTVVRVAR